MWTAVIAALLIAHALIHVAIYAPPTAADAPFDPGHSWLVAGPRRARPLLLTLAYFAATAFAVAGVALVSHVEWWRLPAVIGAGSSLALLVLFFNPWLTVGVAINVAVIVVLAQTDWPVVEAFGW